MSLTYYVDNTLSGDTQTYNSRSGSSLTGRSRAFATITSVNAASFSPGDSILFRRGQTFREQLTVPSSGTENGVITFGSFGQGTDPVISGSDLGGSGWTSEPGAPQNVGFASLLRGDWSKEVPPRRLVSQVWTEMQTTIYYKTGFVRPKQVIEDGVRLVEASTKSGLGVGMFWWDATNRRLYVRTMNDDDPAWHTLEISQRNHAVYGNGKSHLKFIGLVAEKCGLANTLSCGFLFEGTCSNITLDYCTGRWNWIYGARFRTFSGLVSGVSVTNCLFEENGANGVYFNERVDDFYCAHNVCRYNCRVAGTADHAYAAGLKMGAATLGSGIVEHNECYGNDNVPEQSGIGIYMDTNAPTSVIVIRYNHVHDNTRHGIMCELANNCEVYYNVVDGHTTYQFSRGVFISRRGKNNKVYNNVIHGTSFSGIGVDGNNPPMASEMTGNIVRNNIVSGSLSRSFTTRFGGDNNGTHGSGNVYDHNCWGPDRVNMFEWGFNTTFSTHDALEKAYGSAMSNVEADPQLVDPENGDFTLDAGSPCIDTGVSVSLTSDYLGVAISGNPDMGAYERVG